MLQFFPPHKFVNTLSYLVILYSWIQIMNPSIPWCKKFKLFTKETMLNIFFYPSNVKPKLWLIGSWDIFSRKSRKKLSHFHPKSDKRNYCSFMRLENVEKKNSSWKRKFEETCKKIHIHFVNKKHNESLCSTSSEPIWTTMYGLNEKNTKQWQQDDVFKIQHTNQKLALLFDKNRKGNDQNTERKKENTKKVNGKRTHHTAHRIEMLLAQKMLNTKRKEGKWQISQSWSHNVWHTQYISNLWLSF